MIDPENIPAVDSKEMLARFILSKSYFRADKTLKPNAFMPPSNLLLSVTRHRDALDKEIWDIGQDIASTQGRTLYGRGDLQASTCIENGLNVQAEPVPGNPNHADISNWPSGIPEQKIIALELAVNAVYISRKPQD